MTKQERQRPIASDAVGKRLGDWVVVKPLAAGGMGELYLGARPSSHSGLEVVAIKQLLPHLCWDPELVRMFLAEVRIASCLAHPNIVRVLDWGTGTGGHYFVMEYVHGENLGNLLRAFDQRRPPLELAVGIVAELADGLHYAHEYVSEDKSVVGVVHRDVSPSNVMVGFDGGVKLLDFGIARISGHTRHTKTGGFKGKIGYMSPEQCEGTTVDRRTDVFSLGVLLYELSLGRRAFFGGSDFAVVANILAGEYARPLTVDRYYPPALAAIVERAMQADPAQRYATAAEMAMALRQYARTCALDLNPHARANWMHSLFSVRPWPSVDVQALERQRAAPAKRRAIRNGAAIAAGLALGVAGFVAGNLWRSSDPAADDEPRANVVEPERGDAVDPPARVPAGVEPEGGQPVLAEPPAADLEAPESEADDVVLEEDPDDLDGEDAVVEEADAKSRRSRSRRRNKGDAKPKEQPEVDHRGDALLPPSWRG